MDYEALMKRCIELAKQAEGQVSPNPLVGAVVLDKENKIIAEGFHKKFGENHAERNALLKLSTSQTEGGTIVVNLEPCSHYGKTPPCADLIIEKKIKRVVIGMRDVNPVVAGNGIAKLKAAGIEVVENVLEPECKKLNEVFIKNMVFAKTFVAIKSASTIDGKIATSCGSSKWITSAGAREEVLKIRNRYDAILTSSATVIADNPTMQHRKKIIIDRELKIDIQNSKIFDNGEIILVYDKNISPAKLKTVLNEKKYLNRVTLLPAPTIAFKIDFSFVLDKLFEMGVMSILVEAGGRLNGSVLPYADKIYQFIAPKILGDNKGLSCYDFRNAESIDDSDVFIIDEVKAFAPDILLTLYKK